MQRLSTTQRVQNLLYVLTPWQKWVLTLPNGVPRPKVSRSVTSQESFLYSVKTLSMTQLQNALGPCSATAVCIAWPSQNCSACTLQQMQLEASAGSNGDKVSLQMESYSENSESAGACKVGRRGGRVIGSCNFFFF